MSLSNSVILGLWPVQANFELSVPFPAALDTSVADIVHGAPTRTGAGACACPVQYRARTVGATRAAWPVSPVTSSMVTVA